MPQPTAEEFDKYWHEKCIPQVVELIENYDAKFFWFDSWADKPERQLNQKNIDQLIAAVRGASDHCLINSRIGTTWCHPEGDKIVDYLSMGDNEFPEDKIARPWETSGTFNNSWACHQLDFDWKSSETLLKCLVDNVSRGGNFQLNVGPEADGSYGKPMMRRLKEIGGWLAANDEAIYSTMPVALEEPNWGRLVKRDLEDGSSRLYCHVYDWNADGAITLIKGLTNKVKKAFVLETNQPVETIECDGQVGLILPNECTDDRITVVAVDVEGTVAGYEASEEEMNKRHSNFVF